MCVEALPHDFPAWQTVYYYFALFRRERGCGSNDRMIREAVRNKEGREAHPSAMIVDSQSVQECGMRRETWLRWNKKIIGRKRNLVVDTLGLSWWPK